MRAMRHNSRTNARGRVHGLKHNDRNFDTAKADNIDGERSADNVYWNLYTGYEPEMTFEAAEMAFYFQNFSNKLDQTNAKYIEQRHPERCKTMEQFMKTRIYAPEESTLQIGKMESHVSAERFLKCYESYRDKVEAWNAAHGNPFTLLDYAVHFDEAVPHAQERKVWHYRDEQGNLQIGQEKALIQAGVELPHPDKPQGRRNNRKMTFDAEMRELWLDTCHEHGIKVEREPLPDSKSKKSKDKEDMIREKYQNLLNEARTIAKDIGAMRGQKAALSADLDVLERVLKEELSRAERHIGHESLQEKIEALKQKDQDGKLLAALKQNPDLLQLLQQRIADQRIKERATKKKESGRDSI